MSASPPQPQSSPEQATFQIDKIYVKDLSLEIPNAPQVFVQPVQPTLEVHIDTESLPFDEPYFEVTVSATVTAKAGDRTVFLAEAVQAGIFSVRNVPEEELAPLLGICCPNILFPYLRETISDLVTRGGFPPVLLSPISFEALYMQKVQGGEPGGDAGGDSGGSKIEVAR